MTVYSIRDSLGQELYWSTKRRHAIELAEQLTEPGSYIVGGRVHHSELDGLKPYQLPVGVLKATVIKTIPVEV